MYVAVVGKGLVGAEFVDQLLSLPVPSNPFNIFSISSSKKTWIRPQGLVHTEWKKAFESSASDASDTVTLLKSTLGTEMETLVKAGHKVVLVDNTSSDTIAQLYPRFLSAGVNVITPNKKAFSSDLTLYEEILTAGMSSGAKFYNESTVGAGLPVISTLKDLVTTGDNVSKIEGVFSGTMSYIFNNFSTSSRNGPTFSSVVTKARELGYTEPHPADDLNGADVARKLTILSRFIPELLPLLPQGYISVDTKSLVPPALKNIATGDEFIQALPTFDDAMERLRTEALQEGKVLRYVGVIDVATQTIKASLEKYDVNHAFATSLGGSDNIIMFHTNRYGERPLIIQGAGAGAAVTAMGVLSDLLRFT
ncbi:hypothetical protein SCHPADRAFT_861450 [Schizopora paradoxa]|uniref:Homoserine dehydrogenase n=1 Tax=Schizopora paradoxa TaxID=27342 RepID=A0A0H2R510_9AGAM|nr:hypothetical protein SCHPADRAFT_861450 [Schizopora paradoxa]